MIVGQARIREGLRVYAVGDVHGCVDELSRLMQNIDVEVAKNANLDHRIVFLGDYTDRGPANQSVINYLIELKKTGKDCVFIKGNHDDKFLGFIDYPERVGEGFLRWGGIATLRDYGVVQQPGENLINLSKRFDAAVPRSHKQFQADLLPSFIQDDYFFCHAGVRPGTNLDAQKEHDLIWIRDDFLCHDRPYEKVIIHGHTAVLSPEVRCNRINVDTQCYRTGRLTAVVLENNRHRFIHT